MDDPGPDLHILWRLLLLFGLILINAFFAMSEIAVISLNDTKIERMANEGNRRARRIRKLTANTTRFLSMIQIGVTLAGFLASAAAADSFGLPLRRLLEPHMPAQWHGLVGAAVTFCITLLISYLTLVLGELAPKRIALRYPEKISLRVAGVLGLCAVFLRPLVWVVSSSANSLLRLIGIDPNADDEAVTEEEIRMLVDAGGEKGVIEEAQQEMINNIFEFDDIDVADIMTHRTNIIGVEVGDPIKKVVRVAIEEGCSRIPVYEEDIDSIIGVAYAKDLLPYVGTALPDDKTVRDLMRAAHSVPETKRCGELFKEMTANHVQIAIVVDEYGGTAGLVTLEDVLESIVGSIQDEYDNEADEIARIDENSFRLDGMTDVDEIEELTGAALPEGDYNTVAGFVISKLGYLPKPGETPVIRYGN
ncbi:MAG: hemolysin family protein, partial [Oscillospiraceae bacterium]|nr:hemolysin family protein [Oscillospiraceae bacterium]